LSPGSAVTGFPPGIALGAPHIADAVALQAQADLTTAFNDAAGRALTASVAGDLVGQTLLPGVYKSTGPLAVSGALTLNGQGNPNSVFIFQVASTLITASASSIVLTNSAQACNIYWQVGSSATLGTASSFKGTIMALESITVTTGTRVEGRALARNGQVSLDTNVFTMPGCDTTTPTPTVTETVTATATATVTATPTATVTVPAGPLPPAPLADTGGARGTGNGAGAGTGGTGGTGTDTGTLETGMNQGTNVDTAGSVSPRGPGELISALAVVILVAAAAGIAGRRRPLGRRRRS
jgi:type VI secretion system secreted protein VgrG